MYFTQKDLLKTKEVLFYNLYSMVKQPPQIYLINRDRALTIMWYIDAFYDEFKCVKYEDVKDKVTHKEWMITQMYFNN